MPTTYVDQFYLIDQNDDGDIDAFNNDSVDGQDVTQSYPGDTVTITLSGGGTVTYTGITFYLADGRQVFTPTDGQVLQSGELASASGAPTQGPLDAENDLGPPCFVAGTLINTPQGRRPIEDICVGDFIETADHGPQVVRWVGARKIAGKGRFAPIRFAAGALGNDRPMLLSP